MSVRDGGRGPETEAGPRRREREGRSRGGGLRGSEGREEKKKRKTEKQNERERTKCWVSLKVGLSGVRLSGAVPVESPCHRGF